MFENESKFTEELFIIIGKRKGEDEFELLQSVIEEPKTDPFKLTVKWRKKGYTYVDFHCMSMDIVIDSTNGDLKRVE